MNFRNDPDKKDSKAIFEMALAFSCRPGQVFLPHMAKQYTIKLDEYDLGQILDGLQVRADSWRRTAEYLKTGEMSDDSFFIIEECSDHEEAERLTARYEDIIGNLRSQIQMQA